MRYSAQDIHSRFACALVLFSLIVVVVQASYPNSHKSNEIGVLACGMVLLSYIVFLIGILEHSSTMIWVATNLAMFIHGFQMCYYYFTVVPALLMLPPLVLGGLFLGFAITTNCTLVQTTFHKSTTTEDLQNETQLQEFEDVDLV